MINGVLLDLSGVLYVGRSTLPGAVDAVARLRAAGLPIRFLTNSTRNPKARLIRQLAEFGINVAADEVYTPAQAACDRLAAAGQSPHLLVHPDLNEDFAGCRIGGDTAVVVGDAGAFFTFDAINAAFRALNCGADFLALAANRVFKDDDNELSIDVGAFVHALEFASGTKAEVMGKPARSFFQAAADSMGSGMADVAMIGDDAEADVAGALTAGVGAAVLVRTGKYQDGDEGRVSPRPSAVVDSVVQAVDWVLAENATNVGM